MAAVIRGMAGMYQWLIHDLADERTKDWPLLSSPFPVMALIAGYVYLVKVLGPALMRDRPAFKLDRVIQVYNVIQIALSLFMVERTARACYYYFLVKIIDLLDTVFFVLRKKNSQVTFLHVYHHSGMVAMIWGGCKYLPGGHGTFLGFVNSIVHAVMYTYYLVTSIYPQHKQNIWWKKHITQMQMVQFFMITVHALAVVFQPNCNYPRIYPIMIVPQNAFMFALFYDFYRKAYFPAKSRPKPNGVTQEPTTRPHES